jgi:type I restriction enzyme R subunit
MRPVLAASASSACARRVQAVTTTIRDKVSENDIVMQQIENNSAEQALRGDFSKTIDDAIMDSNSAHQNQMIQLLSDPKKAASFARVVFDLLVSGKSNPAA